MPTEDKREDHLDDREDLLSVDTTQAKRIQDRRGLYY